MRCAASETLEILRLVEGSPPPAKRAPKTLGLPRSAFHRGRARRQACGEAGLEDRRPHPGRVWNRLPGEVRREGVEPALDRPEPSPRAPAARFPHAKRRFVSEASAYRIPKARDLVAGPAFVAIRAADAFRDRTVRPNRLSLSAMRGIACRAAGGPTSPISRSSDGAGAP